MMILSLLLLTPGQIETVESKEFPKKLQATAVTATVLVVNGTSGGKGSGAVVGKSAGFLYVLTANHVVDGATRIEVHTFSPDSYPKPAGVYRTATVVAQEATEDLALVRVSTLDEAPGIMKICPTRLLPAGGPFKALSVGCSGGDPPTCLVVDVTGKKRVRKRGEVKTAVLWETIQEQSRGRSGGPLVDGQGRLIGVGSVAGDGKGYYGYAAAVHKLLQENGFKWISAGADR